MGRPAVELTSSSGSNSNIPFSLSLAASRLAFIGIRDVDAPERAVIEALDIASFPMKVVDRLGVRECLARALDRVNPAGDRAIHVSFDIDALDHTEAPATGTSGKFCNSAIINWKIIVTLPYMTLNATEIRSHSAKSQL